MSSCGRDCPSLFFFVPDIVHRVNSLGKFGCSQLTKTPRNLSYILKPPRLSCRGVFSFGYEIAEHINSGLSTPVGVFLLRR